MTKRPGSCRVPPHPLPPLLKSLSLGTDPLYSLPSTPSCAGFLEPRDPGGFWTISSCLGGGFLFFFFWAMQGGGAGREAHDWARASQGWRPTGACVSLGRALPPPQPQPLPLRGLGAWLPLLAGTSPVWHFLPPPPFHFAPGFPRMPLGWVGSGGGRIGAVGPTLSILPGDWGLA